MGTLTAAALILAYSTVSLAQDNDSEDGDYGILSEGVLSSSTAPRSDLTGIPDGSGEQLEAEPFGSRPANAVPSRTVSPYENTSRIGIDANQGHY